MNLLNKIIKMETKLKYVGEDNMLKLIPTPYYLVEMPNDINGKMMFLLDQHTNTGWGDDELCFTGMRSIILTERT